MLSLNETNNSYKKKENTHLDLFSPGKYKVILNTSNNSNTQEKGGNERIQQQPRGDRHFRIRKSDQIKQGSLRESVNVSTSFGSGLTTALVPISNPTQRASLA